MTEQDLIEIEDVIRDDYHVSEIVEDVLRNRRKLDVLSLAEIVGEVGTPTGERDALDRISRVIKRHEKAAKKAKKATDA